MHDRDMARDLDRLHERLDLLDQIERRGLEPALSLDVLGEDASASDRVSMLQATLETENDVVYERIRDAIRRGGGRYDLLAWLRRSPRDAAELLDDGYDHRDEILAGVLQLAEPGMPRVMPTAEMVFYQPTPARHIVELIERTAPSADDVLVDLGSGLGHVPIVTAISTGARAIGIEIEPAYVECARDAASALNVHGATFVEADATTASLDEGTIFHLYTPFGGAMLRAVLDALRAQARMREIRISTLGPCTHVVGAEPWLVVDGAVHPERISIFRSRSHD